MLSNNYGVGPVQRPANNPCFHSIQELLLYTGPLSRKMFTANVMVNMWEAGDGSNVLYRNSDRSLAEPLANKQDRGPTPGNSGLALIAVLHYERKTSLLQLISLEGNVFLCQKRIYTNKTHLTCHLVPCALSESRLLKRLQCTVEGSLIELTSPLKGQEGNVELIFDLS
jgi:hypothetical protein